MSNPKPPTRSELAQFLPSQRAIRAFEALFNQTVPSIDDASLLAVSQSAQIMTVLGLLEDIASKLDLIATQSNAVISEAQDDLSVVYYPQPTDDTLEPRQELGTLSPQNSDDVDVTGGTVTATISDNTAQLLASSVSLTDYAAANVATLTNAPSVGNPTKWVAIDDNGTTRYIPMW